MAFESLTDKLQNVFKKLKSKGRLTEEDVKSCTEGSQDGTVRGRCQFQGR